MHATSSSVWTVLLFVAYVQSIIINKAIQVPNDQDLHDHVHVKSQRLHCMDRLYPAVFDDGLNMSSFVLWAFHGTAEAACRRDVAKGAAGSGEYQGATQASAAGAAAASPSLPWQQQPQW